jgi:transposase
MNEAKGDISRIMLITGETGRRYRDHEDRDMILATIAESGTVITEVPGRKDICISLIYKWRKNS